MRTTAPKNFAEYSRSFPANVRDALQQVHSTIREAVPSATETISYNLPAFSLNGKILVCFGAFKSHIGFYPGAAAVAEFAEYLAGYKTAKGSVQFPLDRPIPLRLVRRIVRFKVGRGTPA